MNTTTHATTYSSRDAVRHAVAIGMMFSKCVVDARAMLDDPRMAVLHDEIREHIQACEQLVIDAANRLVARGIYDAGTDSFGPGGRVDPCRGMACWEPEADVSPRSPVGLIVFMVLLLAAVALGVMQAPQCRAVDGQTTLLCAD